MPQIFIILLLVITKFKYFSYNIYNSKLTFSLKKLQISAATQLDTLVEDQKFFREKLGV
jgi:hypothetical protein